MRFHDEFAFKKLLKALSSELKPQIGSENLWQYHAIAAPMRGRIPAGRTMLKSLVTSRTVPTVLSHEWRIAFVHTAGSTEAEQCFMPIRNNSSESKRHIGIDLMGSDGSPARLLQGLVAAAPQLPRAFILDLFGGPELLSLFPKLPKDFAFHPTSDVIHMEDDPLLAIRQKRDSSLCAGIRALKAGKIDAFISAGNTGALLAYAKLQLPSIQGMERPALLALLPTRTAGEMAVLDIGANTTYTADHLVQFAKMGVLYQRARGLANPRVGLLNIGTEAIKGTTERQEAYKKLLSDPLIFPLFVGNIEARNAFEGHIDVLVTDGFAGNIFLKTAEGIASVLLDHLEAKGQRPEMRQEVALLRKQLNYADYPGALLCGVEGLVFKCHGDLSVQAFLATILQAEQVLMAKGS